MFEISKTVGWMKVDDPKKDPGRVMVSYYLHILNNVVTEVLDFAKQHQEDRVTKNVTNVTTFNFTEGWFRDSGIYDLQLRRLRLVWSWRR